MPPFRRAAVTLSLSKGAALCLPGQEAWWRWAKSAIGRGPGREACPPDCRSDATPSPWGCRRGRCIFSASGRS